MTLAGRVVLNTLAQAGGKLLLALSAIAAVRLTADYLGLERFGELAIVLAFAPILVIVSDLGITTVMSRELAKTPERADELGARFLWLRLVGAAAVFVLFLPVVPFLPYTPEVKVGLVVAAAGASFTVTGTFPAAFFQVNLRLEYVALLDALSAVLTVALLSAAVALYLGFYALVSVWPLLALVTSLASFTLSRRFWRIGVRKGWASARPLLRDALPIGLVTVLGLLHFKVDSVMLSLLKPPADVGTYTVAYRFLEQALVLPTLFMAAVFPILTRALHERSRTSEDLIRRSFHFLLLLALPLAVAAFALARPLVHLVAGEDFDEAVLPLRILLLALVFAFVNVLFASILLALDRRRELVAASLGGLALNVGLNVYFIGRYSYLGAAATTVFSELAGFVLVFLLARRAYPFRLGYGVVARAAAAALAMAFTFLVLAAAELPGWTALVAAAAIFGCCAYAFRAVARSDFELILGR